MKISRPRLRNSKDNEETARTTRSSSTPRSLRQSDLSIMRTQTSGLKRDIADLKRQTKELKKKSPTITRQTRTETKRGIQRLGPSEETASLDSALLDNDSFTMSSDVTDTQESTGGCYDKLYENETAYGVSCSLTKSGIVNGECESKVSQAEDKEDDEMSFNDVDSDDTRVEVSTADGNEGTRGKRRKRRRRFMPKKKPKLATYSADDVVNSDSRLGKRGRKHQTERCEGANGSSKLDTDREMTSKEDTTRTSIIRELQTSKGFVDKVELNELLPMRRTPRMASLNAIAKVNAVLESYSANGGKTANDLRDKNNHKKSSEYGLRSKEEKSRKRSTSSVTQTDDIIFFTSVKGEHKEWMMSGSGDVFHQAAEEQPISDSMVSSTSNLAAEEENTTTKDKAVQTVVNHKAVQTDLLLFENSVTANSPSSCTCGYLENVNSLEHRSPSQDSDDLNWVPQHVPCTVYRIPPTISSNTLNVPLCSSLSTKTTTHTIAIPFTKTHILEHTEMKDFEESTNLSTQSNKRMASLNAVAMMNAIKILDRPLFGDTDEGTAVSSRGREFERSERRHLGQIRIPRITYQATSTSKFSMGGKSKMGNVVRASQMKSLSNHLEHLIESKKQTFKPSNKIINGWVFEGEPSEKPYADDDKIIIRRYYPSMRRNEEVINVRDAVLLKSGPRKKDLPFVARVAAIWEDDEGHLAGDMMMSVFWYYRPEQTEVGKLPGYHGELEVLASRHRDDNSAACVVDKCYVLSYPQYCRFRAKNKLFRESRKAPLSPVPPTESTRPGIVPPANTDPKLVFFCRHAYDSRTGRILKNPFY